ncbi:MAG: hypothetical protein JWL75_105 [Parcubacteria group bacterium]|nr:hypothetical protein [Parcubacteria group bacterium]
MELTLAIAVGVSMELLVIGGALAAYTDRFFFVSQMKERGIAQGFPFVIHGGMWSDFFIISPLAAFLIYSYATQWTVAEWITAGVVGVIVSLLLHFLVYIKGELPGSHGYDGKTTVAGWLHIIYTAVALAVLALFYFSTAGIRHNVLGIVSVILALHPSIPLIGQALANKYGPDWFPENPFKIPGIWLALVVIWLFIVWRCLALW